VTAASSLWVVQDWETAFFGIKTARVRPGRLGSGDDLAQALAECRDDSVQVVHFLVDGDDDAAVRAAEASGFHLVDVRVTLSWRAVGSFAAGNGHDALLLRAHRPEDVPALRAIAGSSYSDTRYYRDGRYEQAQCAELYATWIARSCDGMAERVIVAERGAEVIGYVSCHHPEGAEEGKIGLVGVASAVRGLGVGQGLVAAAQRWFAAREALLVSVVTQGRNVAAQRLYQRAGFVTASTQLWYHRWLDR
jgi:dTDP-4-amino-4,6-dideoxy-D-galactose acyltransferase